ncbi:MAG: cupredoxin domain-containing protein [Acidimicrobiia bacterium]|nr:cupredoxin domain-containing protein [Acidimicrobiia bacterium]
MRHTNLRRAGAVGFAASALLLGLGACSDDDTGGTVIGTTAPSGGDDASGAPETGAPETTGGGAAAAAVITIAEFAYNDLTVAAGSEVEVTNADGAPHTVTSTDDAFPEVEVGGGESGTFAAPAEPGTYEYFCNIHGAATMSGTLVVE